MVKSKGFPKRYYRKQTVKSAKDKRRQNEVVLRMKEAARVKKDQLKALEAQLHG